MVLAQFPIYNRTFGSVADKGTLVYQSAHGVKVWDAPKGKGTWLARILLNSTRATIKDKPVKNPTGYMLETKDRTFPALAVNGKLSDQELRNLADCLVPAKECLPEKDK